MIIIIADGGDVLWDFATRTMRPEGQSLRTVWTLARSVFILILYLLIGLYL